MKHVRSTCGSPFSACAALRATYARGGSGWFGGDWLKPEPRRRAFDLTRVLRTRYRSDAFQQGYFVIAGFDALLRLLEDNDLAALYAEIAGQPDLDP